MCIYIYIAPAWNLNPLTLSVNGLSWVNGNVGLTQQCRVLRYGLIFYWFSLSGSLKIFHETF